MKIIELRAENIKRLTAVTIRPDGNLVEITGKNGQGKTSVLDSIWWAIAGKSAVQSEPIRRGAKAAMVRLDLGDMIVTRRFRVADGEAGPAMSLTVEQANGARFPSPQKLLDTLLGQLSFDPLAFTRMKPAEQFDVLKEFVPGVDFAADEAANAADYDARTEANREAKRIRARMQAEFVSPDVPDDPVDEAALAASLQAAADANTEIERIRGKHALAERNLLQVQQRAEEYRANVASITRQLADAQADADKAAAHIDTMQAKLDALPPIPEPTDLTPFRQQLADARRVNALVEVKRRLAALRVEVEMHESLSEKLTASMAERAKAKREAIAAAKMPVAGVDFGEGGTVLLNGVPFDQASDAEQLRASVAIAAAANPKLQVIRVRDGSLLDEDGLALLGQFADEHDMQVWVERVESSGKVGFVMEDGHLKE